MTDSVELRFTDPSGDELRFEWPIEALEAIAPGAAGGEPAWRLGGELDWDELETVRLISGRLDDGRLLAVAASDGLAVRVAGTAGSPVSAPDGGIERLSAPLDLRAGGGGGAGVLDVLRSS